MRGFRYACSVSLICALGLAVTRTSSAGSASSGTPTATAVAVVGPITDSMKCKTLGDAYALTWNNGKLDSFAVDSTGLRRLTRLTTDPAKPGFDASAVHLYAAASDLQRTSSVVDAPKGTITASAKADTFLASVAKDWKAISPKPLVSVTKATYKDGPSTSESICVVEWEFNGRFASTGKSATTTGRSELLVRKSDGQLIQDSVVSIANETDLVNATKP